RLEQPVPEAQDGEFLDRLLSQVVVDAKDLVLVEDGTDLAVQAPRALQVGAERLLDDDARPAALRAAPAGARQARLREALDDLGVDARGHRQVEEPVAGRA